MLEVAEALTGNSYDNDTFIVATSGRCEYRNKGLDVYLDSVARLGDLDPTRKVLAFVMVPAWVDKARPDLALALGLNNAENRLPDPVITHTLHNFDCDAVISRIHQIGFTNDKNSRVSVIYVPCYLNGADGIFDMTYYQLIPGFDATVFASYYEPWGYTPLESVAFGVPTVTTSLSGFGQWVMSTLGNGFDKSGVTVVERTDSNYDQVCSSIAGDIKYLVNAPAQTLTEISLAARATAAEAAWSNFIVFYQKAFETATINAEKRNSK